MLKRVLLTVQRFIFLIIVIFFNVAFFSFAYYYFDQRENTASAILKAVNYQLLETSYHLSEDLVSLEDIASIRPMFNRIISNDDFIKTIYIHDGKEILVTTDSHQNKIIPTNLRLGNDLSAYDTLEKIEVIERDVNFREGENITPLKLVFVLDKNSTFLYFNENTSKFLLYFGIAPVFIFILIWFLLHNYISKPLQRLHKFAYNHKDTPKAFTLKELETIRHSMVKTFKRLEDEKKELFEMLRKDLLSSLANRKGLEEYVERLIATSSREHKEFAFLFLDLDNFKTVNDSLGHNIGDELLKKISFTVNKTLRANDFIARVGGDEFVIIVENYNSLVELIKIIDRIRKHIAQTWLIHTHSINIESSIGIAFYPKDGDSLISLMKNSDIAMYEAKRGGRARYHFFTEELNKRVQDTIALDKNMRKALLNKEYQLYYQPKVSLKSGKIVGVEALIRWISPTKGVILPDTFIGLAEENGFVVKLGWWVAQESIRQYKVWRKKNIDIVISINIAAKQLLAEGFVTDFKRLLEENGVEPNKIDIEITEYMFFQHNDRNFQILQELHDFGVTISLDDFGTGYSSLTYLKSFPIDNLKIDKTFIDDYDSVSGSIFIETIVKMGQTLKMKVVAEGAELKEQVEYLKSIGCDQCQGYYFSKPIKADDFETLFLQQKQTVNAI
ncbi:MAG: hypothetical protein A3K14_06885 [Sulfurimonas sp. RIFCSPLOWO2_12_FULL_36_74]|uniref:putative bifunctional diguanylate cyclase/phosphodiesterase n=1 Tax=Sulfurimonas sp. RIFCSPLOWO2_12_36_12 TaxID=1802253 RepID=UPI0008C9AD73|nr:EAL domain-containing protein [Sulfurimonas sp. RIFCSPLOWO2_12_36_12]OHD96914.1 MAG: hypothetical protein A3J26_08240 [Sulfurimonas sp. RIFCSPLOWO2_02_FULL_36_28]OHE02150.1 MAG: hypothetical protein A2W82_01775 [Sulfurimonas sp. RIFCSPLOWO2_12_36_12]OHE04364.1 MAG: hypothetical protein A3K14_06885 [Sulfurimonas sp. RIFCSPLOWO2_12_FULL_36_74]